MTHKSPFWRGYVSNDRRRNHDVLFYRNDLSLSLLRHVVLDLPASLEGKKGTDLLRGVYSGPYRAGTWTMRILPTLSIREILERAEATIHPDCECTIGDVSTGTIMCYTAVIRTYKV